MIPELRDSSYESRLLQCGFSSLNWLYSKLGLTQEFVVDCAHALWVVHSTKRLVSCLTTLETRRLRGDQIEVFKIVNGYEYVDRNMFFKLKEGNRTRGHKAALRSNVGWT